MGIGIHDFFHQTTSARKRRCNIIRIKDETGVQLDEIESIKNNVILDFSPQFKSERYSSSPLPNLISPLITVEDNLELIRPISKEEIYTAIFHIDPYKALGQMGLELHFINNTSPFSRIHSVLLSKTSLV